LLIDRRKGGSGRKRAAYARRNQGPDRGWTAVAPRAVTLDLFGTLIDFDVQRDETPLVEDLVAAAEGDAEPPAVLGDWMQASLADRDRTPFRRIRPTLERGARAAIDRHGLAADPARWAHALEELWATRPLAPGAGPALDRLDGREVRWAIVTNLDAAVLDRVLERTGLARRGPAAVCSEHARAYKPHPRPFHIALDRLGVEPGSAVHVGDDAGEDRAGAQAAGLACVLVGEDGLEAAVERALDGRSWFA